MVPHNCYCLPAGRSNMTRRHAEQDFPDVSQVSHHKRNKINLLLEELGRSEFNSCVLGSEEKGRSGESRVGSLSSQQL
jgi:hypothetical protein